MVSHSLQVDRTRPCMSRRCGATKTQSSNNSPLFVALTSAIVKGLAIVGTASNEELWTTAAPRGSRSEAAVSGANGVIFGCNLDAGVGRMYAVDAKNGTPLWAFESGGPCNAGPSIVDGTVYWGSGTFNRAGPKKVFAFRRAPDLANRG